MSKKNNKIVFALFLILIVLFGIFLYVNSTPYMSDDEIDNLIFNTNLYTTLECEDGFHTINIDIHKENNELFGDLYIPGEYEGKKYLFWDSNDNEIQIKKLLSSYGNGQYLLDDETFQICLNNKKVDLKITIVQTSKEIEPLFIEIDESLGTINDMNNDYVHKTSCYGQAIFNNESYYMSIKGRGNSTWTDCIKKPYNITFTDSDYSKKQSVSMIDGIETKKWSLLANYMDLSLLRNRVGYDLANKLSIGIDSKYYDVWMNGNYLGNYLVTPKNDYLATEEGYILEIDNTIDEEDPQFYLKENGVDAEGLLITVKNNDAEAPLKDIQSYMQKTWEAIRDYDSDEYEKYIDVDSWAKAYLINELNKNWDVVCGSIIMHRDTQDSNDKLIAGPIWDLDYSLGQLHPPTELGISDDVAFSGGYWYISSLNLKGRYSFFQELGKHKSFLEKVKEVYNDNKELFNDLVNQVDINVEESYDSFLADFRKWGNDREQNHFYTSEHWDYGGEYPINYQPTNNYDDYMENLKKYIISRVNFLNNNINNIE